MKTQLQAKLVLASTLALPFLVGCASNFAPLSLPSQVSLGAIQGTVHGGQQPVSNSHVYVMQAAVTGYGVAATSLISTSFAGTDSIGKYVLSDANGGFSVTGSYTCTSGAQVYLLAEQGNPGLTAGTNNTAIGLMAAVGTCPVAGNLASTVPFVTINEVSTVVAAYALAGFATDATHIASSSTALAAQGLANAFAAVPNIMTVATGVALTATSAPNSTGVVPQSEINTLADILATCVNASGPTQGNCPTLFADATADGTTNGTRPTETATSALNIAHHPAQAPTALYNLQGSSPPFLPTLSAAPNDFTLKLYFSGSGLTGTAQVAVDGSGNVWGIGNNTLSKLSPLGAALSGTSGFTGGGLNFPTGLAVDTSGNIWVANYLGANVSKFNASGVSQAGTTGYTGNGDLAPNLIAIDTGGFVWVTNSNNATISKLSSSGSEVLNSNNNSQFTAPTGVAIDASNNVWTADPSASFVRVHSNSTGVELGGMDYTGCSQGSSSACHSIALTAGSNPSAWVTDGTGSIARYLPSNSGGSKVAYSGGGQHQGFAVVLDGAGNVWCANSNSSVSEFSSAGAAITPSTGYTSTLTNSSGIAVDGSGNVWVSDNTGTSRLAEFVGAATPVVTPLVRAAINNNIAGRP